MKKVKCCWCNIDITHKDIIGANRKLSGEDTHSFYCLDCMTECFGCDKQDILDKIAMWKEEGCVLFQ